MQEHASEAGHADPVAPLLLGISIILLAAKVGDDLLVRLRQPAVLGEMLVGVVLGNLAWLGFGGFEFLRPGAGSGNDAQELAAATLDMLARIGVILLLFEVGLESSIHEMRKVGWSSFLVAVLGVVAPLGLGWLFRLASLLRVRGMLMIMGLVFCFGLAWAANLMGLAPIVGAFAAGLILDEKHYANLKRQDERSLEDWTLPITTLLVPIFFVMRGFQVDLRCFRDQVLLLAGGLTVAAIVGKQVCSLGVLSRDIDRLSVGFGMIPRGEVGLIFAAIGQSLISNGQPVIQPTVYSAIVAMVMITTVVTPPLLSWSLRRSPELRNGPMKPHRDEL